LSESAAAEAILRWRKGGPALFAQEVLGAKPTDQQWEASRALVERRRVSIRSGHGTGKSAFMAWAVLWGLSCWHPIKIPVTAPTAHQLGDVLWAEIALWLRKMPDGLKREFEWKSEQVARVDAPREAFAVARTSRPEQPEALQGFHSENILFVIDEASGIPEAVFQVAEGALSTDGAFVIMAANPTRMEGYFFESHHKMRDRWAALHWNGEDSPLVSRDYVADMAAKYGVESAIYKIRVRGDFAGNPDGIIPLDLIEAATDRDIRQSGPERWGLDVARFGEDRTALAKRSGNTVADPVKWWRGKDTMQVAGLVKLEYEAAKVKPEAICVDVIGLGAGVVDRMKELGLPVIGINVAESPSVQDRYERLRDELWFRVRDWFAARDVRIVQDDALAAELTLPTFTIRSSGKIKVEGKDDLKRRGVTSPDLADAFCLTFADGLAPGMKWKPLSYDNRGIV
jgi:phage terminase large subunit